MNISVIVCAAGKGERAGFEKNKLLVPFMGACALYHTLSAFNFLKDAQKIAVCAADDAECINLCRRMGWQTVTGGDTRTASVYNALKEVTGDVVAIHDGARPFVTRTIIESCIADAAACGSGVCALPSADTVVTEKDGKIEGVLERARVCAVQTPQCFNAAEIKSAYESAVKDGGIYTDDGSVYSRYIRPAKLSMCGSPSNRKLTYKEDFNCGIYPPLPVLPKGKVRVGFGVDVHAFGKKQDYLTLCGVRVPCDEGLVAHSDGDVAVHALMDALLSGAGLNDIGWHFPDTDMAYSGADSVVLLKKVAHMLGEKGLKAHGLSLSIQAEKPKLCKYIGDMKGVLSQALGIEENLVAIAAGTAEGLGFVGNRQGICAYCIAVLEEI